MINGTGDSSLHVVITGPTSEIDDNVKDKINGTFNSLFNDLAKKVLEMNESEDVELIYEVQTPVFKDGYIAREFYENLEVLLDELKDFNPHFTQFRGVDN